MTRVGIEDSLVTDALKGTTQHYHELYEMTAQEPSLQTKKLTNELYHSEPIDWLVEEYKPTMYEMYAATALYNSFKYFGIDHDDVYFWSRSSVSHSEKFSSSKYARGTFRTLELTGYSVKEFLASMFLEAATTDTSDSQSDEINSRLLKSFITLMDFVFDKKNHELMQSASLDAIDVVRLWARSDEIEFSWGEILGQKEWLESTEVMDLDALFDDGS